ncbi:LamG domain-containing protein, partial [Nonomuraea sp. NPDC059007]|uniref:LamG domain-containing protein n=1 Tax=Nonomuraea sp. NPDC059007 TaxID=3346692 RepID=UPI0036AE8DB8
VTYDGSNAHMYVNGTQVATTAMTGSLIDDNGTLRLGGNTKWGEYFKGLIDEVRIYNRAQTPAQIQTDMNAPVVSAPKARSLEKARTAMAADDNNPQPPPAIYEYGRMTPDDCKRNFSRSNRPEGYARNHFSWCSTSNLDLFHQPGRTPTIMDFHAKIVIMAYTFNGNNSVETNNGGTSRDIFVDVHVYDVRTRGGATAKHLTLGVEPVGTGCEHVTSWGGSPTINYRTKPIGLWQDFGSARFRLRCPDSKAPSQRHIKWSPLFDETVYNLEKMSISGFKMYGYSPDWPSPQGGYGYANSLGASEGGSIVRCDSATYIKPQGGCVFNSATPMMIWKLGQGYDTAYQHYWKACYQAHDTFPVHPDKRLPGCYRPGAMKDNYLHREDSEVAESVHKKTWKACTGIWGSYAPAGKECDEYPFAGSFERANAAPSMFSLCPIRADHNGLAGTLLENRFFIKDRVIVGDIYYNKLNTTLENPPTKEELCGRPVP